MPTTLARRRYSATVDRLTPTSAYLVAMHGETVVGSFQRIDGGPVPAKLRVIVTRRPKYACRRCTDGVVQAPAPNRLIEGGLPTEMLVADVLASKYADHLPLYRQAQILAREGIAIDRSTLAHWVGFAAHELEPLHARLLEILKASTKLFADETRCPVLDPGRGRTKTGYLWAIARDDRPWGSGDLCGKRRTERETLTATMSGIWRSRAMHSAPEM
jgi:transposase